MEELTKETADILDLILKTTIEEGVATPNNLPPLKKDFISKTKEGIASDYAYFVSLIRDYDVADINIYLGNEFQVKPYDIKTLNFYRKGGFNRILLDEKKTKAREKEIAEIEFKKLRWDANISRFQARTKWWPLIISLISLVISLFAVFNE